MADYGQSENCSFFDACEICERGIDGCHDDYCSSCRKAYELGRAKERAVTGEALSRMMSDSRFEERARVVAFLRRQFGTLSGQSETRKILAELSSMIESQVHIRWEIEDAD